MIGFSLSRSCLTFVVLAGVVTAPSVARSQAVRGRVTVRGSQEPVPSGIVSLLDSAGTAVATTLADDSGAFVLTAATAGRYSVRAERVGYRSTTTPPRQIGVGDTIDVPISLSGESVSLRAVKVTADRRCIVRPHEGLVAAQLWEEARKALSATALTQMAQATARQRRDPHRFTVRIRRFSRTLAPATLAEWRAQGYEVEGESVTPFSSREPRLLARDGYVVGNVDDGATYYAPDATVLLSDQFLDAHCFRVQAPSGNRRDDLIGLAFEPVAHARSDVADAEHYVDVRGVLWLDRASAELRYMDYQYTNLRLDVSTDRLGGQIEFRPLPDGRWVAWRWYIRMPKLERKRVGIDPVSSPEGGWRLALQAILEEGGEVLEVFPPGSRRVGVATVSGVVYDSLRPGPLAGARVFLSGTSLAAVTGVDGHYRIDSVTPGAYTASVLAPRLDSLLLDAPVRALTVSAGEDAEAHFGVPAFTSLSQRWCPTLPAADTLGVVLGIVRDTAGLLVRAAVVVGEWKTFAKPDPNRLSIRPLVLQSESIEGGRFALCGLPANTIVTVRASHGRAQQASVDVRLEPGEVRRVDLSLRRR